MTNRFNYFYIALALIASLLLLTQQATAAEEILSFDSNIHVHEDSTMTVTEKITVRAENRNIKRGIYRDFPTKYNGKLGNKIKVGFEIIDVLRNGSAEPYHTKKMSNGLRIYIGSKNSYLNKGEHTYTIQYKTNQQLGYFDNHDELYWNVTGNGWEFPILKATASVQLPESIRSSDVKLEAYTGVSGSKGQSYDIDIGYSGNYLFKTNRALSSKEGLTIVAAWPNGHINEPKLTQKISWWWQANINNPTSLTGMIGLFIFYFTAWWQVGRDPKPGTIIPHYQPPDSFPPGAMRYINEMGHDKKAFTAAILNLAVKGYLKINNSGEHYELEKLKNPSMRLPIGEHTVLSNLFKVYGQKLVLKNTNHSQISSAISEHKKALKQEYNQSYFVHNKKYLYIGISITILLAIYIFTSMQNTKEPGVALFLMFWLSIWTPVTVYLIYGWYHALRRRLSGEKANDLGTMTIFAGAWTFFEIGALTGLGAMIGIANGILIILLFLINVVFYYLLKKPTLKGRKLLNKVEGFKNYLEVAEQEELNLKYTPKKTPKLFEVYLPYALALGVENQWAEQFTEIFKTTDDETKYHPTWYSGNNWNTNDLSGFTNSMGNSLSSAISSSSTAPGSSSGSSSFGGSGGGFSGGGGGGGGGGGW